MSIDVSKLCTGTPASLIAYIVERVDRLLRQLTCIPFHAIVAHLEIKEVAAVIPELLWIIGFYAAAAIFAHWLFRRGSSDNRRHYVLVAGNHQMQIEWYIRALQHFSRRTGTEIGITVVLDQSSDDTGKIMERFARGHAGIDWVRKDAGDKMADTDGLELEQLRGGEEGKPKANEQVVWVELARSDDVARLPL